MSSSPEQLPPSQAVGQQTAPMTVVPHTPDLPQAPNNGLAMVSLITGVLSYLGHIIPLIGGSTLAIVAIITGMIARNQIRQTGEEGMTAATIGIVLGVVNLGLVFVVVLVILFVIFVLGIGLFGIAVHNGG